MSYVVRRSGRKLGNVRDARTAHAIYAAVWRQAEAAEDAFWSDNDFEGTWNYKEFYKGFLPTGWAVLGRGAYRITFLSPKGVVYKVNKNLVDGFEGNGDEMDSIIRVKGSELPRGWVVPDATLYRVPTHNAYGYDKVIAMPLVDTSVPLQDCDGYECVCHRSDGNKRLLKSPSYGHVLCTEKLFISANGAFRDLHAGNVFPDREGTLWVVDVS